MKAYLQRVVPSRDGSFVFREKSDTRFLRGFHCHPEYELTYIIESRGRRLVGDSVESYAEGDCVLLGPGLPHTWRSEDRPRRDGRRRLHRAIVVQFGVDFLGRGFLAAPELAKVAATLARASSGLLVQGKARDEVARRLLGMRRLSGLDRLLELLRALQTIAQGGADVRELSRRPSSTPPDAGQLRRMDRVLAYLEKDFAGPLTQREAARLAGLVPSSFSRFFRRAMGRTFVAYLAELRIARAAELLRDTHLKVLEIALLAGFSNLSNFNRRFRALRGVAPREFREQAAGAPAG